MNDVNSFPRMNEPQANPEQRLAMLSQAMTASTEMYKENSRILSLLDDKAQKTAGLAGVFFAAAFAFSEGIRSKA